MTTITKEESSAIDSLRLMCVLCVVMIHSCSLDAPFSSLISEQIKPQLNIWHHICCFMPECLCVLFILSGYLFFRNVGDTWNWKEHYINKLKARFTTLFLFFFVWCLISIAYYIALGKYNITSFSDFLTGFWPPHGCDFPRWGRGMWFIRSLIAFSILSPLYYLIVRTLKHFTPVLCLFLYSFHIHITFPYFNLYLLLGCYLGYMGISLTSISKLLDWRIALFLLTTLHILTKGKFISLPYSPFVNILLALIGYIGLFLKYPVNRMLTAGSTFLYAAHFYLFGGLKRVLIPILPMSLTGWVLNMILTWLACIILCYIAYRIISKSNICSLLLTGGRAYKTQNKKNNEKGEICQLQQQ